jgi:mRNA-degrading endonuclease toxin of MazEF toxin-antitoxin module
VIIPVRGLVYRADLGYGLKPFLVVSNNARNQKLDSCLMVRLTATKKPELTSIVQLDSADDARCSRTASGTRALVSGTQRGGASRIRSLNTSASVKS